MTSKSEQQFNFALHKKVIEYYNTESETSEPGTKTRSPEVVGLSATSFFTEVSELPKIRCDKKRKGWQRPYKYHR